MLCALVQFLNLFNDPLVLLGLHCGRNGHATEYERRGHVVVFRDGLEIGYLEAAGRFLEHIGEVLGEQAIEPLEGAKT